MIRLVVLATAVLSLTGCLHVDHWRVHDDVRGIESAMHGRSVTKVMTVHGMGVDNGAGYSRSLQVGVTEALAPGYALKLEGQRPLMVEGRRLGTITWSTASGPSGRLAFYEVSWAEATEPIKKTLLELDAANGYRETTYLESHRAPLNSTGKNFVNTHLSDPVIYAGQFGAHLRSVMKAGLCQMLSWDKATETDCVFPPGVPSSESIVFVTESLGSAILFDALGELSEASGNRASAARSVVERTAQVYMLANQIPLIELREIADLSGGPGWLDRYPCYQPPATAGREAALEIARPPRAPSRGLSGFLQLRSVVSGAAESGGQPALPRLEFVAFSDANDLLTYHISERIKERCKFARFANVTGTNATTVWFGLAANPLSAHTGFRDNPRALRIIAKGAAADR